MTNEQAIQVLKRTQETIRQALKEASTALLETGDRETYQEAEAYWLSAIDGLTGKGPNANPYEVSIEATIRALKEQ
jgi:hypothetical protein